MFQSPPEQNPTTPQPYPACKPSGVPWLGDVPAHWEVRRGGWLFRKMDRPVRDCDEVITCFRDGTVTLRKNRRTEGFTESLQEIGYQGVRKGDLVIHQMDAFAGAVGVSDSDGKGTPVYSVCHPRQYADSFYYAHIVREMARNQWILALAKGIRERSTDFRFSEFARQPLPLPPLAEQTAIARYLDHADRRIRRYVSAKRRLIALLEEERQAVVNRAVTRGLDPNARLKPSGVEWLGDVPAHWETMRARFLFNEVDNRSTSGKETHLSMSQTLGLVPSHLAEQSLISDSYVGGKLCQEGDLVLNRLKAHLGVFALAKQAGVISPDYSVFRKRDLVNTEYFFRVLRLPTLRTELRIRAKGIVEGFWRLYTDDFFDIRLPAPPYVEQRAIVEYVERTTADADAAIARARRQIELLEEYRTRLIADVVTGKLDVREAAAQLEPGPEEEETVDGDGFVLDN